MVGNKGGNKYETTAPNEIRVYLLQQQSFAALSKSGPILFFATLLLTVHPQQSSSVSHHPVNGLNLISFSDGCEMIHQRDYHYNSSFSTSEKNEMATQKNKTGLFVSVTAKISRKISSSGEQKPDLGKTNY